MIIRDNGKEKPKMKETMSVTIANRFQVLEEKNEESTIDNNERIAEIKYVTSAEAENQTFKQNLYDEMSKAVKQEN